VPEATVSSLAKSRLPRWAILAIATLVSLGGTTALVFRQLQAPPVNPSQAAVSPKIKTVTALGRLEPQGEVIKLSAPSSNEGNRVDQLLVQEGDRVKAGQVVAILNSRDRLQTNVAAAQEAVRVAQANLAQTLAGAKQGEIAAQRAVIARTEAEYKGNISGQAATVERLAAELQNAQVEHQRYQALYQAGAVSASQRDSKRLTLETARKASQEAQAALQRIQATRPPELQEARATLDKIAEVRPADVTAAQAEVSQAIAAVAQAKAELEQAYVRAPQAGVVLEIGTHPGELVSSEDGIVELGQTQQMVAVAEVYQSDIGKVRLGQRVRVTSNSLPGELQGTVKRVGSQVRRQEIVNTDPSTNIDARVVEVHVALDQASSQKAAKFTNLQVEAEIEL